MKNTFKLFGITAIAAVIVFSMASCGSTGGGSSSSAKTAAPSASNGVAKTLVVTGIDGFAGDVLVTIANDGRNPTGSMIAVGGSAISNKNLTIPLVIPGRESDRWTGIGEYFIVLVFEQNGRVIYFYSQGGMTALRYNFTEATTTIAFDQFRKL